MILELCERDTEVLEQILSILKNHPEIEKIEVDEEPMVSLPGLEIFPSKRKVFRDRQEIQLTTKEYRILLLLATNKGRVLTYAQIYEQVWGDFTTGNENNTIGFHICNLREKLYRARVLAMAGCHQLCPGADTAFQLSQIFDAQRRFLFVLLIQSSILLSGLRQ